MKTYSFTILFCLLTYAGIAQTDSAHLLKEVTVTGIQDAQKKSTSLHLEPYSLKLLDAKAPLNLSDALAEIPGVSQITTGTAISKPVIRGLYGNRILVLLSGLRFDNQQFQDEHGLGLSQIGIDRIELIKGPASILYGTDAIGGVINVIEETPTEVGTFVDVNTRFYSNTLGTLTDVGLFGMSKNKTWWRLRGGIESQADYTDGNGDRVLDSRNKAYYAKAGFGFTHGNWIMNNTYDFSNNLFGFIIPDLSHFMKEDDRYSRSMEGPHHIVTLNIFSSQNTFLLKSSTLKINLGFQSNHRMEDEGGGEISLNMRLLSGLENAKWEKQISKRVLFVINQQFTYENNTNLGKRILIPDANMLEGNLSAFTRFYLNKVNIEIGAGYNYKDIETFQTKNLNSGYAQTPDPGMMPFDVARSAGNAVLGITYNPNSWLNIKGNLSTGDRAANLAELSSNGMHEGYYRYEVGNPNLKMEQNVSSDVTLEADTKRWFISASVYDNHFFNYIYLDSVGSFVGFPVYDFKQQNARIYGGEFIAMYKPESAQWLDVKEVFTYTEGTLDGGGYLPFIPAYKNLFSAIVKTNISKKCKALYVEPEFEYVFPQNHPSSFERKGLDYGLVNLYSGLVTHLGRHDYNWGLSVRNLLNKAYYDHLSRLQDRTLFPEPIYNEGRNIVISFSTKIGV